MGFFFWSIFPVFFSNLRLQQTVFSADPFEWGSCLHAVVSTEETCLFLNAALPEDSEIETIKLDGALTLTYEMSPFLRGMAPDLTLHSLKSPAIRLPSL